MTVNLPQHIAIIMDGNGRWAEQRGLPRYEGHKAGYQAARRIVRHCGELGIQVLTLFAFSSENWARPNDEVTYIMELFFQALTYEMRELHQHQVQLRVIGDIGRLSQSIQQSIAENQALTAQNTGLILVLAVNYGGQWDIVQAAKQVALEVQQGKLALEKLDTALFETYLSTRGLPNPDLFIRASQEQRISNFLNWQLAYSELYFAKTLWPDFDASVIDTAIQYYQTRERRFGLTSAQIKAYQREAPC